GQFRITYFQNQKLQLSVQRGQIDLKIHDFEHVPNFFILYYFHMNKDHEGFHLQDSSPRKIETDVRFIP
ncbi:MAG: hypothetical protein EZS28_027690, partial [Streblomastix strix]